MVKTVNIDDYNYGKKLGEKIEEAMNTNISYLLETKTISHGWSMEMIKAIHAFLDCDRAINLYDIAIIFQSISQNENVNSEVKGIAKRLVKDTELNQARNNNILYKTSGSYLLDNKISQPENKGCLYPKTIEYIMQWLVEDNKLTKFDICVLVYALYEIRQITSELYNEMKVVIEKEQGQCFNDVWENKRLYQKSLFSRYLTIKGSETI
ncbi:hypothetical protein BUY35_06960 [Staphylococcus cohnii]|nr:hypothetical protein BUY35_06960 [Staphylococcus cohnii]